MHHLQIFIKFLCNKIKEYLVELQTTIIDILVAAQFWTITFLRNFLEFIYKGVDYSINYLHGQNHNKSSIQN